MTRYRKPPVTYAELAEPGQPLRLRDVMNITGVTRPTILAEMDRGELHAFRIRPRSGSPWMFTREEVRRWWSSKLSKAS